MTQSKMCTVVKTELSTWTKLGYIYYEGKIPTFERNLLNRRNFLNITYFSPTTYLQRRERVPEQARWHLCSKA